MANLEVEKLSLIAISGGLGYPKNFSTPLNKNCIITIIWFHVIYFTLDYFSPAKNSTKYPPMLIHHLRYTILVRKS